MVADNITDGPSRGERGGESAGVFAETLLLGNTLRRKAKQGFALGTFLIELSSAGVVEAMALAGFDFVVLDLEHSSTDFSQLENLILAGRVCRLPMLVRVWEPTPGLIGKVLDIGASGVMAPHVESPAQAKAIVDAARFPPSGARGFSPLQKFNGLDDPLRQLSEAAFVVVQLEGKAALDNADEIAAVEGVDAVFIGPYDLALSLSLPPGGKDIYAAIGDYSLNLANGVAAGIYIDNPEESALWRAKGFALQCASFDSRMLVHGAKHVVSAARGSTSGNVEDQK
ncbi:HpcH/HpaI aldolase family protein [Hyphococcus luteus]|nr:aldolase/citrate lyase family protein [Marinicaulis flavus]